MAPTLPKPSAPPLQRRYTLRQLLHSKADRVDLRVVMHRLDLIERRLGRLGAAPRAMVWFAAVQFLLGAAFAAAVFWALDVR